MAKGGRFGRADTAGSDAVATEPIRIWDGVDAGRVYRMPLAEGTMAQIIYAYGDQEIQINDALPRRLQMAVAEHVVARHATGCFATHCAMARTWQLRYCMAVATGA